MPENLRVVPFDEPSAKMIWSHVMGIPMIRSARAQSTCNLDLARAIKTGLSLPVQLVRSPMNLGELEGLHQLPTFITIQEL
jgi:hypothetical protein